jgi:hypothetical protein
MLMIFVIAALVRSDSFSFEVLKKMDMHPKNSDFQEDCLLVHDRFKSLIPIDN